MKKIELVKMLGYYFSEDGDERYKDRKKRLKQKGKKQAPKSKYDLERLELAERRREARAAKRKACS